MFGKSIVSLAATLTIGLCASANALDLNVQERCFADEPSGAQFKLYNSNNASFAIERLPAGGVVVFDAPLGVKLSGKTELKSDAKELSLTALQPLEKSGSFKQVFRSLNGGVLASSELLDPQGLPSGAMSFHVRLPLNLCEGRAAFKNGEALPAFSEIGNYVICEGAAGDELRIGVAKGLELGFKALSGVKSFKLLDARRHARPESSLFISIEGDGAKLEYFFSLLKPGERFPSTAERVVASGERRNLLGEGSDFEAGPKGFVAVSGAPWLATKPAELPLFDDKTSHQGRFSLRLGCLNITKKSSPEQIMRISRERNIVWFSPLKLDPLKSYVLSAWMKTDVEGGLRAEMSCHEQGPGYCGIWGKGAFQSVAVGKEWRRYVMKFKADNPLALNYRTVQFMLPPEGKTGSLWIDEVQLEEGDVATDYEAAPREFGVAVDQPYKIFDRRKLADASISLFFRNNGESAASCEVKHSIRDYWDKPVLEGSASLTAPAGGNALASVKIPADLPCGYYRAFFESADGELRDEAIFGIYEPVPSDSFVPNDWPLGFQAEGRAVNPLVRELGFGWLRAWQFTFASVMPEEGKTDFETLDIYVDRCQKAKFNLMPILGPALFESDIPAWAAEKNIKSSVKNTSVQSVRHPRMEFWRAYVSALVGHYKGKISAFEVFNEPNCFITPDEYLPYLKAACEAAKAANPDCVIVGGCTTSDLGQEPAPWTSKLIEQGGVPFMDVLSVHMYSDAMPEVSLKGGTDKFLAMLHGKLAAAGKDMPIWHTEKTHTTTTRGYSKAKSRIPDYYPHNNGYGFKVVDFRAKAEYMLRETLIDSVEGKGPFFWFEDILDRGLSPRIYVDEFGHVEFDGSPCPEILAANGFARMLLGRNSPKELLKLGDSKYCALFEGPSGALAAIWDKDGASRIRLPKSAGAFTVCNFFGAKTPSREWLELDTAPKYLLFDGKSSGEVKKHLLESEGDGPKFVISGGLELEGRQTALVVHSFNKTWKDIKEKVAVDAAPEGWSCESSGASASAPAASWSRCVFPLSKLKASSASQTFDVSANGERAKIAIPPFKSEASLAAVLSDSREAVALETRGAKITVDGDLSEWSDEGLCGASTSSKVKRGRELWKGPSDLSVEARFRWDAENLYAAYVVYDDVVQRDAPANAAFSSDCVEMFLSFDPEAKEHFSKLNNTLTPSDFQLLFAPGMESGVFKNASAWVCQMKSDAGIKIASRRFNGGYALEAAIPWKAFSFKPSRGSALGMSFQASDTDSPGVSAGKTIYWSGEWSNCITPRLWGKLSLQ